MVNPIYQQDEELLLNPFGSKYLGASTHTDVNSNEFVVQEDAVISVLTGGDASITENDIDYRASMNLVGVTLKKGALIVAPVGEAFKNITIDSGAVMAYNSVVEGTKPGSFVGLLDLYPEAAAAYSLRKLRADYSGSAIRVRVDTTGNPTYDIGFDSNGELDTADLVSKAAGNSAYVHTWYDQSGNGNNATQGSASAQPKIVNSGSVILENGKPVIEFDGSNDFFSFTNISTNNDYTGFQVVKRPATSTTSVTMAGVSNNESYLAWIFSDNICYFRNSRGYIENNLNTTTQQLLSSLNILLGNMSIYANGNLLTSASPIPLAGTDFMNTIGRRGANYGVGNTQEIVLYSSNQSTNRVGIETNINTYYTIYE